MTPELQEDPPDREHRRHVGIQHDDTGHRPADLLRSARCCDAAHRMAYRYRSQEGKFRRKFCQGADKADKEE